MDHISNLDRTLVTDPQNLLHEANLYVHELKNTFESVTSFKDKEYDIAIHVDRKVNNSEHRGCYNAPKTNEDVVVFVNQEYDKCDIVICAGVIDYIGVQKHVGL